MVDALHVVVEHCKKRTVTDAADVHWHVLVGEVDPATGRILRSSFDRVIHELISRISEHTFGHAFVRGKHTKTVINGLRKRKLGCIADSLETLVGEGISVPSEAFTHAQHQEKKRLGLDLPALRQEVKIAVNSATSAADLSDRLAVSGMKLMAGNRPNTWIVQSSANSIFVGALHRLAGWRKYEVNTLLAKAAKTRITPLAKAPHRPTQSLNVPALTHSTTLTQQNELSTIGEGLVVTTPPIESVRSELNAMEMAACRDLQKSIPMFIQTSSLKKAKIEVRATTEALAAASADKWHIQERLWNTPQARWWTYLIGANARRHRQIQELEANLHTADAKLRASQIALSAAEIREVREERLARQMHTARVKEIAALQNSARHTLRLITAAAAIMLETPDLARNGSGGVLQEARNRIALQDVASAEHTIIENCISSV